MGGRVYSYILLGDKKLPKRKSYAANLKADNFKNDLYDAVKNTKIGDSSLLSSCLYTYMDNTWENPDMKLVLAITNWEKNQTRTILIPWFSPIKTMSMLFLWTIRRIQGFLQHLSPPVFLLVLEVIYLLHIFQNKKICY